MLRPCVMVLIPLTYTKRHEKRHSHTVTQPMLHLVIRLQGNLMLGPVLAFPHGPLYCFWLGFTLQRDLNLGVFFFCFYPQPTTFHDIRLLGRNILILNRKERFVSTCGFSVFLSWCPFPLARDRDRDTVHHA